MSLFNKKDRFKSRQEKINFIKAVQNGSVSLQDLEPKHFRLELFADNDEWENTTCVLKINGSVVDGETYKSELDKAQKARIIGKNLSITITYNGELLEDYNKRQRPKLLEKYKDRYQ